MTQLFSKAPEVLVNQVLLGLVAVALSQVLVLGEAFAEFREAAPGIGVSHAVRDEPWSIHIVRVDRSQPR